MLKVEDLSVYYDGLRALHSVSLEVEDREMVCILGPNGAGKSTLLQTIAGLLEPRAGQIILGDRTIQGLPPHRVAALGLALVPEEGWLYPQMNVTENLLMGAFPKEARGQARERLDLVYRLFPRLKERRRQMAETLSGGERQMLAVGRGLMSNPRVLMLDEPSLGLAPMIIKDIMAALVRINQEEKVTVVLTEQNIFHALKISRRGYVLENGRVALAGRSEELLASEHVKKNYLGL
ncbi:MAG: ABC transporter ATP-binding protein [Thermodesulfobacteriota bacterium]